MAHYKVVAMSSPTLLSGNTPQHPSFTPSAWFSMIALVALDVASNKLASYTDNPVLFVVLFLVLCVVIVLLGYSGRYVAYRVELSQWQKRQAQKGQGHKK